MMKKYIFSLPIPLIMLLSYHEYIRLSQIVIQGTVLTEGSLKPVADAFVYTVSGEEEALTDKNGKFKLTTWQSMPVAITVEHRDFKTACIKVTTLPANQSISLKRK
jgi:protocatechuate 3,4-dioxygenase beta subunit